MASILRRSQIDGGLPSKFYILSLSGFLFKLGNDIVAPVFTLHLKEVGATIFQIGTILSIQSFLLILLRIPLTFIARRVGETKMLVVAFLAQSGAQLLYGFAPNPRWFYFIPFVQILAIGTFFQLATAMNSNLASPENQGDALGRFFTFYSLAKFIGPIICGLLVNRFGYKPIFFVAGAFPLVGLLVFLFIANELNSDGGFEVGYHKNPSFQSLTSLFSKKNIVILAIIRIIYSVSNNAFLTLFSLYAVNELDFNPASVSGLFSMIGLTNTFIKVPIGRLSDRFERKTILFATYSAIVLNYGILSVSKTYLPVAISTLLFGFLWGTRAVVEWTFLTISVPPEVKNIAISGLESFWDLGATIGSFFAGLLSGILSVPTIFLLLAGMNLPTLRMIFSINKKTSE